MRSKYVPEITEAIALPMGYDGLGMSYDPKSPMGKVYGAMDFAFNYLDGLFQGYEIYFAGRRKGGNHPVDHTRKSARGTHDKKRLNPDWVQQGRGNNPKRTRRKKPAPGSE